MLVVVSIWVYRDSLYILVEDYCCACILFVCFLLQFSVNSETTNGFLVCEKPCLEFKVGCHFNLPLLQDQFKSLPRLQNWRGDSGAS